MSLVVIKLYVLQNVQNKDKKYICNLTFNFNKET